MPQVLWPAASDGGYWIDVRLGSRDLSVLIDLGMIDPQQMIGFSLEPGLYDQMKQARDFSLFMTTLRLDASGRIAPRESGQTTGQLVDPRTGQALGPSALVYVARGSPGVPNRVGPAFFHQLRGCGVFWDLDARTWSVHYP